MFERAPFHNCPACRAKATFGILSAGGDSVRRRCTACRYAHNEILPVPDKKVIYLDQPAISGIFKVKSGIRRAGDRNFATWERVERAVNRVSLLQRAIFPQSSIHRDETIVWQHGNELTIAHEMLGGETKFKDHYDIELDQVLKFARAYIDKTQPQVSFDVDDILEGHRNSWLPDLHITVDMDWSAIADDVKARADSTVPEWRSLYNFWKDKKLTFEQVLSHELNSFRTAKVGAVDSIRTKLDAAIDAGNAYEALNVSHYPVVREVNALKRMFAASGVPSDQLGNAVTTFWDWQGNKAMPVHRISAYLFAAIARKLATGQKRLPTRGMSNDIVAISTYGPYVDAMFLDNECAALLSEEPLKSEIGITAHIFSLNSAEVFLEYLASLADSTPREIREEAIEIYGIE